MSFVWSVSISPLGYLLSVRTGGSSSLTEQKKDLCCSDVHASQIYMQDCI